MSSTLVGSNDTTVNTSAITGYKSGGSSLYSNKEGYDRQNSYSKETGSGWGSISPRKGEGMQWQQQKQAEQGLIGKLLDSNTSQIERTRYSGLYSVPVSPSAARTQTFSSQSSAMQSSQPALSQTQQQPVSKQQQFVQQQPAQQQQFAQPQQQQQQQVTQPQQLQQSAPLLEKQQSMTQVSSFVNQQSSLPLTQQQHWTQPNKTLWASETGPVTIQQTPVCLPLEALIIKPEPIMVPQEPVVFQPDAFQVAQPPLVFRPEPITIPMPPLTIQPEPVVVQRPPLMVQPPPIVLRRPDVQMNPEFSLALKYGCSTTNDVACSTDQCVPISSLTPSQQAALAQNQFDNSNTSSLSQTRATRSQSFNKQ